MSRTRSKLAIFFAYGFRCHADHFGSLLSNRSRDSQPSHPGKQRGSFQAQFGHRTVWSTYYPAKPFERSI
jgi:hypothetical protein